MLQSQHFVLLVLALAGLLAPFPLANAGAVLVVLVIGYAWLRLEERARHTERARLFRLLAVDRSDDEGAMWLNILLQTYWSVFRNALARGCSDLLQPQLDAIRPKFLDAFSINDIDFGSTPPFVKSVRAYPHGIHWHNRAIENNEYIADLDLIWDAGSAKAVFLSKLAGRYMGLKIFFVLDRIYVEGKLRLQLRLQEDMPYVNVISFSFVDQPQIDFALKPQKNIDLMEIPLISNWLSQLITESVSSFLVHPEKLEIPLDRIYNSTISESATETKQACGILKILLHDMDDYSRRDNWERKNPYVVFKLGNQSIKTSVVRRDANPAWNQVYLLMVTDLKTQWLETCVYDQRTWASDVLMGQGRVELSALNLKPDAVISKSVDLEDLRSSRLNFQLQYLPADAAEEALSSTTDSLSPTTKQQQAKQNRSRSGLMRMTIHCATADGVTVMNPYVTVRALDKKVFRTRILRKTPNPNWEESFELIVTDIRKSDFELQIKDFNPTLVNELLGTIRINLSEYLSNELSRKRTWLDFPNGIRLCVSILFRPVDLDMLDLIRSLFDDNVSKKKNNREVQRGATKDSRTPEISGLQPCYGSIAGGTAVTVRGNNLGLNADDIKSLFICGVDCRSSLEYISHRKIKCRTGAAGDLLSGPVIICTESGGQGVSAMQFRYNKNDDESGLYLSPSNATVDAASLHTSIDHIGSVDDSILFENRSQDKDGGDASLEKGKDFERPFGLHERRSSSFSGANEKKGIRRDQFRRFPTQSGAPLRNSVAVWRNGGQQRGLSPQASSSNNSNLNNNNNANSSNNNRSSPVGSNSNSSSRTASSSEFVATTQSTSHPSPTAVGNVMAALGLDSSYRSDTTLLQSPTPDSTRSLFSFRRDRDRDRDRDKERDKERDRWRLGDAANRSSALAALSLNTAPLQQRNLGYSADDCFLPNPKLTNTTGEDIASPTSPMKFSEDARQVHSAGGVDLLSDESIPISLLRDDPLSSSSSSVSALPIGGEKWRSSVNKESEEKESSRSYITNSLLTAAGKSASQSASQSQSPSQSQSVDDDDRRRRTQSLTFSTTSSIQDNSTHMQEMFGLLSITVIGARDLRFTNDEKGFTFVKVYVGERLAFKTKHSSQKSEKPMFNSTFALQRFGPHSGNLAFVVRDWGFVNAIPMVGGSIDILKSKLGHQTQSLGAAEYDAWADIVHGGLRSYSTMWLPLTGGNGFLQIGLLFIEEQQVTSTSNIVAGNNGSESPVRLSSSPVISSADRIGAVDYEASSPVSSYLSLSPGTTAAAATYGSTSSPIMSTSPTSHSFSSISLSASSPYSSSSSISSSSTLLSTISSAPASSAHVSLQSSASTGALRPSNHNQTLAVASALAAASTSTAPNKRWSYLTGIRGGSSNSHSGNLLAAENRKEKPQREKETDRNSGNNSQHLMNQNLENIVHDAIPNLAGPPQPPILSITPSLSAISLTNTEKDSAEHALSRSSSNSLSVEVNNLGSDISDSNIKSAPIVRSQSGEPMATASSLSVSPGKAEKSGKQMLSPSGSTSTLQSASASPSSSASNVLKSMSPVSAAATMPATSPVKQDKPTRTGFAFFHVGKGHP